MHCRAVSFTFALTTFQLGLTILSQIFWIAALLAAFVFFLDVSSLQQCFHSKGSTFIQKMGFLANRAVSKKRSVSLRLVSVAAVNSILYTDTVLFPLCLSEIL